MDKQKRERFLRQSALVIEQLRQCLESGLEGVTPEELEYFLSEIMRMSETVKSGNLPPPDRRYKELTHLIMDQWPWKNPIEDSITELEELYVNL